MSHAGSHTSDTDPPCSTYAAPLAGPCVFVAMDALVRTPLDELDSLVGAFILVKPASEGAFGVGLGVTVTSFMGQDTPAVSVLIRQPMVDMIKMLRRGQLDSSFAAPACLLGK